jgi:multiple sugar transport system permease protein
MAVTTSTVRLRGRFADREARAGLLFVAPFIIGFLAFSALPMLASLVLSLTNFDPRAPDEIRFIGLDNYGRMLRARS